MIQPQIDALLAWAAPLHDDIVACKNEYFAATGGEVHEDDACFEQRMQGFFNFFLFDRKGPDGITPVQRYLRERGATLGGQDKEALMGFTNSLIGLYQYRGRGSLLRRVPKGHVRVRDAITGEKFNVLERRQMHGLEEGDVFEARLVPVGGTYHFSTSFTYHPREMHRLILREIRRRKKAGKLSDARGFCWELERMALQAERFKNVSISAIYNFDTPFLGQRKARAAGEATNHG
jgi:hypothetical protein